MSMEEAGKWLWGNKGWLITKFKQLRTWYQGGPGTILIIGPGGVGKTTLAKMIAGEYDSFFKSPGDYEESLDVETTTLDGNPPVEIVVPPGQKLRRESTWTQLKQKISGGEIRGIVQIAAYGYHSIGNISYKKDGVYDKPRHEDNIEQFVSDFSETKRRDEVNVLKGLLPHIETASCKMWFLTVVTKQDLWWPFRKDVEGFYSTGEFGQQLQQLYEKKNRQTFRHEKVFGSLVIRNFETGFGELLQKNTAGYDHPMQVASVRQLIETLDALRSWEQRK